MESWTAVFVVVGAIASVITILTYFVPMLMKYKWVRLVCAGVLCLSVGLFVGFRVGSVEPCPPEGKALVESPPDGQKYVLVPNELEVYTHPKNMVLIPAGEFSMGEDKTVREVSLKAFYMDTHEVTVQEYKQFVQDTNHPAPNWDTAQISSHPMIGMSWDAAVAYCEEYGKRLPTEAEWEKAARGKLHQKKYPWGNVITHDNANYKGTADKNENTVEDGTTYKQLDKWDGTSPVGSFVPNRYGLYDMAGNVWEWCSDSTGSYEGDRRVIRGGGWNEKENSLRVANRNSHKPGDWDTSIGFRCVMSVSP